MAVEDGGKYHAGPRACRDTIHGKINEKKNKTSDRDRGGFAERR